MAFEKGTASSTFDLMDKLTTFMASVSGWSVRSNINQYDKVYYSSGNNGKRDLYIRQRIGPPEPFLRGGDQHDYGDGDTGFLNFQAYMYFPQDGDAYSGSSEIGQFGPRRFFVGGETNNMYHQDILSDQPGGAPHVIVGTPADESSVSDTYPDYYCMERRRWSAQTGRPDGSDIVHVSNKPITTDSYRYFYFADIEAPNDEGIRRYSLRRYGGHYNDDGTIDRYTIMPDVGWKVKFIVYAEDRRYRRPYIYVSGEADEFAKINLLNNQVTSLTGPSWPDRGSGVYEQDANSTMTWNGDKLIYMIREDKDWGVFNMHTETWRCTTDPEDPSFRSFPTTPDDFSMPMASMFGFLSKSISGFQYDRLYVSHNTNDSILYMELDDNGLPHSGNPFWNNQGPVTSSDYEMTGVIIFNRHGRMFHGSRDTRGDPNGIYEIYTDYPNRPMLYADIKESGENRWYSTSFCYFPEQGTYGPNIEFTDGYACRVRTSIGSDTEYIFIADENRVIVATKSNSLLNASLSDNTYDWSVAYMGAIDSRYDATPYGEFIENVNAGYSKKIRLNNVEGVFEEGKRYFVADTTGNGDYNMYNHIWNKNYTISPSESIVVQKVENDVITASLKHNYSAGTKISLDPQPVGLFFWESEKFQMTNISNRLYDDRCGSDDPSAQIYTCSIPEGDVTASAEESTYTNTNLLLWEYIVSTSEGEGNYISREVRGKLKGMYAVGKSSGIDSDQTVSVDGESYLIIELLDYNKYVAIGPINS